MDEFARSEREAAKTPLSGGPFKSFLAALQRLQREFDRESCPIRTALVTARSAPAHERVIRTLRAWDIRIDESLFLGGMDKGVFLKAYGADVFLTISKAIVCRLKTMWLPAMCPMALRICRTVRAKHAP